MGDSYGWFRLRVHDRDATRLFDALREQTVPRWRESGVHCYGIWQGLFGIASNELLVMAAAPGTDGDGDFGRALPGGAEVVDAQALQSTVRPVTIAELPAEGLYVFRFFYVKASDCDEIVTLSAEAWESFEDTDRYASRPQGLFRPGDNHAGGRMLLLTWYDGFASWETSRRPAPEAWENFKRRQALTMGTVAYATRLMPLEGA